MSNKTFIIAKASLAMVSILLMLVCFLGACNRSGTSAIRFASTSDPGAKNAPINNGPPSTTAGPVVSYADIVSRVSPAVITIHSEMRVRAPHMGHREPLHERRQMLGALRPENLVPVVGHETVRDDAHGNDGGDLFDRLLEGNVVGVFRKERQLAAEIDTVRP